MSQQYYIAVDGQRQGPFTIEELNAKAVYKDTLVWTETLDNWTRAEHIPLLQDIIKLAPPPLTVKEDVVLPETEAAAAYTHSKTILSYQPYFGYQLASRSDRLIAAILGGIITFVPYMLLENYVLKRFWPGRDDSYSLESILASAAFSAVLGALFYYLWSGNIGHKVMGLKVISSEDGSDKKSAQAGILREGIKSILGTFLIPIIWILWDEDKQNLYDKVVRTYVVKKKNFLE